MTKETRAKMSAAQKLRWARKATQQNGAKPDAELMRLAAKLIRMLPDEKLIELVK